MKPHWIAVTLAVLAILLLSLTSPLLTGHPYGVVLLERLAPRIERAPALVPETRDTIVQLMDRVRSLHLDARIESRRALAIERVASALAEKEASQELTSAGRRTLYPANPD